MPLKKSTADTITEYCNKRGVSIFLDGSTKSDSARIGTPYTYFAEDKILTIFIANLKENTKQKLAPILKAKWDEIGLLLKISQQETLQSYFIYKENKTDQDIVDFYSDKISSTDLDVLKMSLFLRSEKGMNHDISLFKQQIRERFGERGTYISNLCSSGYFEGELMEFYNHNAPEFDRFYELSVGRELIATFVHAGMTYSTFRSVLESKLLLCRRYQFDSFKIHGFGSWNVGLINDVLAAYKDEDDKRLGNEFEIKKTLDEQQPPAVIYTVRIIPFQ